jgi:hypothetical protein
MALWFLEYCLSVLHSEPCGYCDAAYLQSIRCLERTTATLHEFHRCDMRTVFAEVMHRRALEHVLNSEFVELD